MRIIRIDERLIHGQVIIGWIGNLSIKNVILFHNALPQNIINLYSMTVEHNISFHAFNINNTLECENIYFDNSIYIIKDIKTLYNNMYIIDCIKPTLINLGGIRSSDSMEILEFIKLNKQEIDMILELHSKYNNIKLNAQQLPYSKDYNIIEIIEKKLK